jgi:hypothetical protein
MEAHAQDLATQALARLLDNLDAINYVKDDIELHEVWQYDPDDTRGACGLCGAMGELELLKALSLVSRDLAAAVRKVLSELSKVAVEQNYHPAFQSWVARLCTGAIASSKQLFAEKAVAVAVCCFHLGVVYTGEGCEQLDPELIGELSKCPRLSFLWINGHRHFFNEEQHASMAHSLRSVIERCKNLFHLDLNFMFKDDYATAHVDALMQHFSTHANALESLSIDCNAVSPLGLRALKEGLPKLTELDISHIPQNEENNAAALDLVLRRHERNPQFKVFVLSDYEPLHDFLRAQCPHVNVCG